jgi:hypothetical protein
MCIVAKNVLEPSAFNAEPYLIEFHDFVDNIQEGMKHQVGRPSQAQQGMTFQITLMLTLYFLPWEPDHSQNVKTDLVFKLAIK